MTVEVDDKILLTRPADAPTQSLADYVEEGGFIALEAALQSGSPAEVLDEVEAAGLRGRGGAAFPAARKWRIAHEHTSETKYVVANGGEHEPGSAKDKFLVAKYPHKVLEGMMLCGYATGATKGYLYLIEDMEEPIAAAERALEELRVAGWLGRGIGGTGFAFDIEIHRAPTTYVAGEETAALESIEGRPALPREKPPYPGESGLFGQPTTVNNVETLAHVPYLIRLGVKNYRRIGRGESTGTMLFTLDDRVTNPGVYELPFGATFRDLIYKCGGGPASGREITALLPALSCSFLPAEHLDTPMDHESLRDLGSSLGCGGVTFVEEGEDVVERVAEIAQFFMDEQCGQCPPCRMETNQIVHVLKGVRGGKGPGYEQKLDKLTSFAKGKGRCSLIEMAAAPVLSAVRLFPDAFAARAGAGTAPESPPNA